MTNFTWDANAPLARGVEESTKACQALQDYIDMGAGRSLAKLAETYQAIPEDAPESPPTKHLRTLKGWSSRFEWQARLDRYLELEMKRREAVRQARRDALEDADWNMGQELRDKVGEFLGVMSSFRTRKVRNTTAPDGTPLRIIIEAFSATPSQLAHMAKVASDLQRLSTDSPTENINLGGAALDAAIERELARVAGICEAGTPQAAEREADGGAAQPNAPD